MSDQIVLKWVKNLKTDGEKEEFVKVLKGSPRVLRRLKTLIKEELEALNRSELSDQIFADPNWAFYQASLIGEKRGYDKILQLLNFVKD